MAAAAAAAKAAFFTAHFFLGVALYPGTTASHDILLLVLRRLYERHLTLADFCTLLEMKHIITGRSPY